MAEGEPPHRYALRQAREKFCRDGFIGLCHGVFATLLFVQNLVSLVKLDIRVTMFDPVLFVFLNKPRNL